MNAHHELVKEAKEAIDTVFGDTTVTREQTKESLEDLLDAIQSCLDTLQD